jgi:hypothetical protein
MGLESGPKFNPEESGPERPKTPEGSAEKKEYELERFGAGWKALAAFDVGILSNLKESWTTGEEEWKKREQETGSRGGWMLRNFADKAFRGYQAMEKAGEVIDNGKFQEISAEYDERMADATTDEERGTIAKELEEIKRSREKKITQEAHSRNVRNTVFGMFGEILKR